MLQEKYFLKSNFERQTVRDIWPVQLKFASGNLRYLICSFGFFPLYAKVLVFTSVILEGDLIHCYSTWIKDTFLLWSVTNPVF